MEKVVVDTDIIINYLRGGKGILSDLFTKQQKGNLELVVSTAVLFEFYSGLSLKNKADQILADSFFMQFTMQDINEDIAKIAAQANRDYQLYGKIDMGDIFIAATGLYLHAKLLTENKRHFKLVPGVKFYTL